MDFELWLDESGDFENDAKAVNAGKKPSLIGGLLVKKGTFSEVAINTVIPESFHATKEKNPVIVARKFKSICDIIFKDADNRFVVFNNEEKILILDNNLTYQNILIEGIVKLLNWMKIEYQHFHLDMIIANRVDTTTGRKKDRERCSSVRNRKKIERKTYVGRISKYY